MSSLELRIAGSMKKINYIKTHNKYLTIGKLGKFLLKIFEIFCNIVIYK